MKKQKGKKRIIIPVILLSVFAVIAALIFIFTRFGGFGTGKSADPVEFTAYAGTVADISIPENVTIVGLGEATHGNAEFQQLKLDVFKQFVENYDVKAFALEGDFGGCEQVNRFIHGGEGTAEEAVDAIGFALYRTEEMAELISYMRTYNDNAAEGEDLRFYGCDMQRCIYSYTFLKEDCNAIGVDTAELERLVDGHDWSADYDYPEREEVLTQLKATLEEKEASAKTIHYVDMLLQYCEINTSNDAEYIEIRDRMMAENTLWIAEQERAIGHDRIFIAAHNGHIAKYGSYNSMGTLLSKEIGEDYYAIGTDFYRTKCNLPTGSGEKRTQKVFYSHDPLANAAHKAKLDMSWLDFDKTAESEELSKYTNDYVYMGSLGEGYMIIMRFLPPSYRIYQPPAQLYNSMIFVIKANPTEIREVEK